MFYKNILETIPIFMFGWLSLFTGIVIYNSILYISFNTFFTALPILWFGTFDFEYPKKILQKKPMLYKIGI
jgi:magnesium-transporting ATPase (P-type)